MSPVVNLVRLSGLAVSVGLLGQAVVSGGVNSPSDPPTYAADIAPMIARHCTPCHSPTGPAPFNFDSYAEVYRHRELLKVQILAKLMPPMADRSDFGEYSVTPALSDEQIVLFQKWVRAGFPKGEPGPTAGPNRPHLGEGWTRHEVGVGSAIPAEGVPMWRKFTLPASIVGSVVEFSVVPRSPKVLRHVVLRAGSPDGQVVGVWSPGYRVWRAPLGSSLKIGPGTRLFAKALYQPSGRAEEAGFDLLVRSADANAIPIQTLRLVHPPFVIDAGTSRTLTLDHRFDTDAQIAAFLPDARFYCSRITIELRLPDDTVKTVFETLRWNPYWVGNYQLDRPIAVPSGSRLTARFEYSNDENCPMNEGRKPTDVKSGDTLDDEACRLDLQLLPGPP